MCEGLELGAGPEEAGSQWADGQPHCSTDAARAYVRRYALAMADLSDYPDLHRRESAEDEQRIQAILFQSFAMVDTLHTRFEDYAVQPGTALAGDDIATPYERLSSQAETCIAVAFDNLRTVQLIMQNAGTIPAFAHFGLIRNAIEAAGIGLWLLGPTSRDERVLRSLQLSFENRKDLHGLETAIEGTYAALRTDDPIKARLEELRDARSANRGKTLKPPTITARLKNAQEYVDRGDHTILIVWKMTSGISHGQRSTMYALLDREVLSTSEVGARVLMTSSLATITATYKLAFHYLMDLLVILLARNGTPLDI